MFELFFVRLMLIYNEKMLAVSGRFLSNRWYVSAGYRLLIDKMMSLGGPDRIEDLFQASFNFYNGCPSMKTGKKRRKKNTFIAVSFLHTDWFLRNSFVYSSCHVIMTIKSITFIYVCIYLTNKWRHWDNWIYP